MSTEQSISVEQSIGTTRTIRQLIGRVFKSVVRSASGTPGCSDTITFTPEDSLQPTIVMDIPSKPTLVMDYHSKCCLQLRIEDIDGPLEVLEGSAITQAEVTDWTYTDYGEQYVWTFFRMRTAKGRVAIRWFEESSGYRGVGVGFTQR